MKYRTPTKLKLKYYNDLSLFHEQELACEIVNLDEPVYFIYNNELYSTDEFNHNDKFIGNLDKYKLTSKTSAIVIEYLPDDYILITDATWE
jgi:hypothetical protein